MVLHLKLTKIYQIVDNGDASISLETSDIKIAYK